MARAIRQVKFGGGEAVEVLKLEQCHIPQPAPGHVVVRMTLRPINPVDLMLVRNSRLALLHQEKGKVVIGSEGFGIVHETGESVTFFKPGQRVIPILYWKYYLAKGEGSWQDFVEVAEEDVILVPDCISDEAAAQFVINPWTVYGILVDLGISKGQYLLQNGAGSAVGRQLIQLAKRWGIKTINVVRRSSLKDDLKAIGADEVIDSSTEDVVQRITEITQGKGAFAAVDMLGGLNTKIAAASVRNNGSLFIIGKLASQDIIVDFNDLVRNITVKFWGLTKFLEIPGRKEQVVKDVMKLFEENVFQPLTGNKYALLDFQVAIEESEKNASGGKVLLCS
ncbi:hypothetical protein O6H91_07G115500 [Diphasiastrum complanatum]|uniref:Uncharacterized protein n=1 Tax=Diphasiastrum complanatum TaxID=34168 RepID=A0ACC2D8U8_DIPCM|nr:hypothetical protein O6H91_07G115500 [Diphasiastrum complanatum]